MDSEPRLTAEAMMTLVASDDPPLRLMLGSMVSTRHRLDEARIDTWEAGIIGEPRRGEGRPDAGGVYVVT